jgi:hypothetical protein
MMHNKKNVYDNVFNTVMDVKGKSKENLKAHSDIDIYCDDLIYMSLELGEGN